MKRNFRLVLTLVPIIGMAGAMRGVAQQSETRSAPTGHASTDPSKQNLCEVAGTVVRASTGEPLKKARVFLSSQNSRGKGDDSSSRFIAISDATGHFAFDSLPPGRYDMSVDRTGFVAQRYGQDQPDKPGATLALVPGQKMTDLLFRLQLGGVITGHVTDEDGEPAQGVQIQVMRRVFLAEGPHVATESFAETNDLGEYRAFGLPPGRYYILAASNEQQFAYEHATVASASRAEASLGYLPTYYPGTADSTRAVLVQVAGGSEVPGVDIGLVKSRTYRIRGRVLKTVGDSSQSAIMINVSPRDDDSSWRGVWRIVESKTGTFDVGGISPGSYVVTAMLQGEGMPRESSVPIDVANADVDNVSIVLGPGVDVSGRVTIEGSLNLSEPLRVSLFPRRGGFGSVMRNGGQVEADGSFALSGVSDGTFSLHIVSGCKTCYVKSAAVNGQDVLEKGLQISSGASPGTLEIVYSVLTGTLSGTVTQDDGLPAAGAFVALVPDSPYRGTFGRYKTGSTDQYGAFIIEGVPPGSYKAFAWDKMDGAEFEDPEFLKGFEDKGESVDVEASAKATTQLKLLSSTPVQ